MSSLVEVDVDQMETEGRVGTPANGADFKILAWGNTLNGELGVGGIEEDQVKVPTEVKLKNVKVTSISPGVSHTMFLMENGTVWTCGSNDHGQLGQSGSRTRPSPVEGLENRDIVVVSAGYAHSLAVDKWGTLFAWGSDSHGQLGLCLGPGQDKLVHRPKVVKALATKVVVQVAAGHFHTIILTNAGEIYSCGSNSHGQLGLGYANGPNQIKPILMEKLMGFPTALISSGSFHSFALSVSGSVFGWGKNSHGQLGVSDNDDKCQPTQLETLRSLGVRYITAGEDYSAFLTEDGGVFTCGNGAYGQLGHNSLSHEVLPRKILEFGSVIVQVAVGRCHTLCLSSHDRLYSFGLGSSGQLGFPISGLVKAPSPVDPTVSHVYSIHAGGDQSFVLTNVSSAYPPSKRASTSNGIIHDPALTLDSCLDFREFKPETQILRVTDDSVSQMVTAVEPVDQDIMSLAETLFASPAVWNASFLLDGGQHIPSTYKNMGVDLKKAEEVLSKLAVIKASGLQSVIQELLVSEFLPKLPHQLRHVEILRVYVLFPLIPNFYLGNPLTLPIIYADRVKSLAKQLVDVIVRWFFNGPVEHLQRLISVYKKAIVCILDAGRMSKSQKDHAITICLGFLSILVKMNRSLIVLSYHAFTIPQLINKIDVREDYCRWLARGRSQTGLYFCDYPFIFDGQAKTLLLQTDQILQMQNAMTMASQQANPLSMIFNIDPAHFEYSYLTLHVSRNNIVHDTISNLYQLTTQDLKKPLKVKFTGEEAEDAGGVRKEFFLLLIKEILDPKFGMFKHFEEARLIWFSSETFEGETMYYLIGLLCGLAIYNFVIINLPFPLALYKKLLDERVELTDIKELNPPVGRSMEQILEYKEPDLEEIFGLTFEITEESLFGEVRTVELKPNGAKIPVTQENKTEFVELYIAHIFNVSVQKPFEAFRDGFNRVCGSTVLPLFYSQELQIMVTGNEDYDWGELERSCAYKNGYNPDNSTIKLFWEVFHEMSLQDKKNFLLFLTGNDRIPILGMNSLKMCIQPAGDDKYLPVAHTCFNLLDLPRFSTKERLRYKLLQAIQHNQGFSLV